MTFPGFQSCIVEKLDNSLNLHDSFSCCNICFYLLSHDIHIFDDYLPKNLLCSYFVKVQIVLNHNINIKALLNSSKMENDIDSLFLN